MPIAAVSAAAVSAAFKAGREALDLAQKYKDTPLYQKIVELQSQVIALSAERLEHLAEIKELKEQVSQRAKMVFRNPYWYEEGDAVPYCRQCYESSERKQRIHLPDPPEPWNRTHRRICTNCHTIFYDEGVELP